MRSDRAQSEAASRPLRVALYTYSTRPRGGVVHSIELGQALMRLGHDVRLFALEKPGRRGFFRSTWVPSTFIPVDEVADESIDDRIHRYIEAYVEFLEADRDGRDRFDIHHAEDCISANALVRLRDAGSIPAIVRTIHHVDDFVSPALVHCQLASILEPDLRFVVSDWWRRRIAAEFGLETTVVHNGVDLDRFGPVGEATVARERRRLGLADRLVVLAVGGVEPRKNTRILLEAFTGAHARLAARSSRRPLLLIVGGETLFDYRAYRAEFDHELEIAVASGRLAGDSVRIAGSVADEDMASYYRSADVLAFPSVKEGWGLVVLEAQACGTPVVASDIEVLREYLVDGANAMLVSPDDAAGLGRALVHAATDPGLRKRLRAEGLATAARFDWRSSASRHVEAYRALLERSAAASSVAGTGGLSG